MLKVLLESLVFIRTLSHCIHFDLWRLVLELVPKVIHRHRLVNFRTLLLLFYHLPSLMHALILTLTCTPFIIVLCMCMHTVRRLWKAATGMTQPCYYSRVKDLKSSQVVGSITEKVQECIARVGLHFRDSLIPWNLWHNETTVGQKQWNVSRPDIMFQSLIKQKIQL